MHTMTQKPKVASSLGMNLRGAMACVSTSALATSLLNAYLQCDKKKRVH